MKITFPLLLFLVFLVLKLTGFITWSWWWVSAPISIPAGAAAICALVYLVLLALETPAQRKARQLSAAAERFANRYGRRR